MGRVDVGHFEVDVVHGTDGVPAERSGVDHQLDDIVAITRKHELHQTQVSGRRLVTPELRTPKTIPIKMQDGIQMTAFDDYARVLQVA
jgi:hypothetical protein